MFRHIQLSYSWCSMPVISQLYLYKVKSNHAKTLWFPIFPIVSIVSYVMFFSFNHPID